MAGTIRMKVPELLKAQGKTASDLMYGARLAPATAYRLADGRADGMSFSVLVNLCAYFGVGVSEILEYVPEAESNQDA